MGRVDGAAVIVAHLEPHGVAVPLEHSQGVQNNVRLAEWQLAGAGDAHGAVCRDPRQVLVDLGRQDLVGPVAFEAEQHSWEGAVPAPGGGERTVQIHSEFVHVERPGSERCDELGGGAHRPDGVRTRGSDADLEQVEDADGHLGTPWSDARCGRTERDNGFLPLCLEPESFRGCRSACTVGGRLSAAFQSCLASAVLGPERFPGGVAPTAPAGQVLPQWVVDVFGCGAQLIMNARMPTPATCHPS